MRAHTAQHKHKVVSSGHMRAHMAQPNKERCKSRPNKVSFGHTSRPDESSFGPQRQKRCKYTARSGRMRVRSAHKGKRGASLGQMRLRSAQPGQMRLRSARPGQMRLRSAHNTPPNTGRMRVSTAAGQMRLRSAQRSDKVHVGLCQGATKKALFGINDIMNYDEFLRTIIS